MSAVMTEQRSNVRLAVKPDHAQVTVMLDGEQHQGVLVNQSSEGYGLLVLRGLRVDSGHPLRVVSDDAIHDCVVCHKHPEDNYQHLGLRRIADVPFVERPKKKHATRWFRDGMSGGILSGVVLGFGLLACALCVRNGVPEETVQDEAAARRAHLAAQIPDDMVPTEEQMKNRERLQEIARNPGESTRLSGIFFSRLTGRSQSSLVNSLASQSLNWDNLVAQLELSSSQQESILRLLTSSPASPATARGQLRGILSRTQKSTVDRLAAGL